MLKDLNSNKLKLGLLDLLKSSSTDFNIKILFEELGLNSSIKLILKNVNIKDSTLLELILQMVTDYIYLLEKYPEAFDFQEIQEKEFYWWK
jgi:hypothetical protein